MPFVNDQAFIDALYAEPKKQYKPFQDKPHHRKEKELKIKIKPEHLNYISQTQKEVQNGLRPTVDLSNNSFKKWNEDNFYF